MKRKGYKQFFHGKGISKSSYGSKPMRGKPGTFLDTYNGFSGRFRSRRKYGSDGWAYKDMDTADKHKPYDHIHDIRRGNRFEARTPNKAEKKELEKAKKKRRFF